MECKNLEKCAFVGCCAEFSKNTSVQGFITMYCRGAKMQGCVRLQLSEKFGKGAVPRNMMPNGYPLPGTNRDGWPDEALHYHQHI